MLGSLPEDVLKEHLVHARKVPAWTRSATPWIRVPIIPSRLLLLLLSTTTKAFRATDNRVKATDNAVVY